MTLKLPKSPNLFPVGEWGIERDDRQEQCREINGSVSGQKRRRRIEVGGWKSLPTVLPNRIRPDGAPSRDPKSRARRACGRQGRGREVPQLRSRPCRTRKSPGSARTGWIGSRIQIGQPAQHRHSGLGQRALPDSISGGIGPDSFIRHKALPLRKMTHNRYYVNLCVAAGPNSTSIPQVPLNPLLVQAILPTWNRSASRAHRNPSCREPIRCRTPGDP